MSGKDKPEDELFKALDSLTGLISRRGGEHFVPLRDEADLDLDGLEFGPAVHDDIPLIDDAVDTPGLDLPSPREVEYIVERYLDRRLSELREQLKREILIELGKRFPKL